MMKPIQAAFLKLNSTNITWDNKGFLKSEIIALSLKKSIQNNHIIWVILAAEFISHGSITLFCHMVNQEKDNTGKKC